LADSEEITLAVPEPGGLLANAALARVVPDDLGDAVDSPQARKVVFLDGIDDGPSTAAWWCRARTIATGTGVDKSLTVPEALGYSCQ